VDDDEPRFIKLHTKHWKCPIPYCQHTAATAAYKLVFPDNRTAFQDHKRPQCPAHPILMVRCAQDEFDARMTVH